MALTAKVTCQGLCKTPPKPPWCRRRFRCGHLCCAPQVFSAGKAAQAAVESVQHWPGGRHANDHASFRDIQVLPIFAELEMSCKAPFLPVADGADEFLTDQVRQASLLSRL